jgi:hypothetical protein
MEMTNSKEVAGSGDVSMAQTYSGSGSYVGSNYVFAQDASSTISTNAILTPATLDAILSGSIIGESGYLGLDLISNENSAQAHSWVKEGVLSTNMAAWTGSASVSQVSDINAEIGGADTWAWAWPWNDDNYAETSIRMTNGNLKTNQIARWDGSSAMASQTSEVNAEEGSARSSAGNGNDGYHASASLDMKNGNLKTDQTARHDSSSSTASQISDINADESYAQSNAGRGDDGNYAQTYLSMINGNLKTNQIAKHDGSSATYPPPEITNKV